MEQITSVNNNQIKYYNSLHQKKNRDTENLYLVEGAHLVDVEQGIYDPNDLDLSMLENSIVNDAWNKAVPNATTDWRDQYANSHRYGVDDLDSLAILGLV